MRAKIMLVIGLLVVVDIIFKLVICASCPDDYFGYEMPGYTYLAIKVGVAVLILSGAYSDWKRK